MKKFGRRETLKLALAAPFVVGASRLYAQTWPSRPVQIIMPFGAGGAADTACRVIFQQISEKLGQQFIIENRTGGASVPAAQAVLNLPKDGNVFFVNSSQHLLMPLFVKDLSFDYLTAFTPVTQLASYPQVVAVPVGSPHKTIQEFIAFAKANPGKIRYGTPPAAGPGQMAGSLIELKMGVKFVHIPYRVTPEAARDVAAGTLDAVILTTSTIKPMYEAKKVRILAVTSAHRAKIMPEVPTLSETIIPGFELNDWAGLWAATGTPAPIIEKMQAAIANAAKDPAVINKLAPYGTEVPGNPTSEFTAWLGKTKTLLEGIIKDAHITINS